MKFTIMTVSPYQSYIVVNFGNDSLWFIDIVVNLSSRTENKNGALYGIRFKSTKTNFGHKL